MEPQERRLPQKHRIWPGNILPVSTEVCLTRSAVSTAAHGISSRVLVILLLDTTFLATIK